MKAQTISMGSDPVLMIESVGGDLVIEGWDQTELQTHGENIHTEKTGESLKISCSGDLNLSVPRSARLTIMSVGGDLTAVNLDGPLDISFIGGDVSLTNLSGNVSMLGSVGGHTKLENVSRVSMDAKKDRKGAEISSHVRRNIEQAARRAEQKIHHAERKIAEHKLRHHAQVKANIDLGRWKWNAVPGTFPPGGIKESVSDEERMSILKMLQEKKITSDQAEKLLSALEGGES